MLHAIRQAGPIVAVAGLAIGLAAAAAPGLAAPVAGPIVLAQAPGPGGPGGGPEMLLGQLRQAIRPTANQLPQFNQVAAVMRANAQAESRMTPPSRQASAIDQLRAGVQFDQQELDGMKRLLPALEGLYAVLSPGQRRAADSVFQRAQQQPPQR